MASQKGLPTKDAILKATATVDQDNLPQFFTEHPDLAASELVSSLKSSETYMNVFYGAFGIAGALYAFSLRNRKRFVYASVPKKVAFTASVIGVSLFLAQPIVSIFRAQRVEAERKLWARLMSLRLTGNVRAYFQ